MQIEMKLHIGDVIKKIGEVAEITKRKEQKSLVALGGDFIVNAQANLKPGKLQTSIGNPAAGGIYELSLHRLIVGTEIPYAIPVEVGVSHSWMIPKRPKGKGKWLKFYWEKAGHDIYAKQVTHPPMKGKFFMTRAAIKTMKNSATILGKI